MCYRCGGCACLFSLTICGVLRAVRLSLTAVCVALASWVSPCRDLRTLWACLARVTSASQDSQKPSSATAMSVSHLTHTMLHLHTGVLAAIITDSEKAQVCSRNGHVAPPPPARVVGKLGASGIPAFLVLGVAQTVSSARLRRLSAFSSRRRSEALVLCGWTPESDADAVAAMLALCVPRPRRSPMSFCRTPVVLVVRG